MENMDRRSFLKKSSLYSGGLILGGAVSAKNYMRINGAGEKINCAVAGIRSRGKALAEAIEHCPDARLTHICDVDERYIHDFLTEMKEKSHRLPKVIRDFRKLAETKDIDVIAIATPEHWHAHMTIIALQNGKHVYVEKPCSHNPHEGELIIKAQRKYGKLVQMGNQQRSSLHTIEIISRIHSGLIGTPYFGKAWYSSRRGSIGKGNPAAVPDYLDWELWQGPAPRRKYYDNIHPYNWHWFWHWGTGETLNNGTHEVDVCRWALDADYPKRVTASGGRYHFQDDWEFYDTLNTAFEYDDRMIVWEGRSCNDLKYFERGRGSLICGTNGSVLIDRGGYIVFSHEGEMIEEYDAGKAAQTSDLVGMDVMTIDHFQNLISGIKKGEKLRAHINDANIPVTMLHLSNIAWKCGRPLKLDPENGRILNDAEASRLWQRDYEPGWEISV